MGFSKTVSDVVGNAVDSMAKSRFTRWNISLSELSKDRAVQGLQLQEDDNINILHAMLFKYGLDINRHFEVEVCEHRNVFGEVVYCPYFMGVQRTDVRWKNIRDSLVTGRWIV
ncbi:hypothetical protein Arno18_123 [Pectobacterium phage Arno18]|uniref:Uncharacterized protein n=1 Tax=Pectobacterium phage Arno18 TaxID=2500578 RepID=A0A678ZNK1_9CAUD|nr:hypothetical protein Arno18_123 [Pectobacterium phage Arno18]